MFLSGIVFCCVLVIFVPLYNISNTDLLEQIPSVHRIISAKDGQKSRSVMVLFRLFTFAVCCGLAMTTDKVELVLNLAGGIAIPFVSFHMPVAINKYSMP